MASGSVGANDKKDLIQDLHQKSENCIVYTRKNRNKGPSGTNRDAPAASEPPRVGAESASGEPSASSSPAKNRVSGDGSVSEGIPVVQDGSFKEPIALEGRDVDEALPSGGAEPPVHGGPDERLLDDGAELLSNCGKELDSNNRKDSNGVQEREAAGREEDGLHGSQAESLNNDKESQPIGGVGGQGDYLNGTGEQTVLANIAEEPQLSGGQVTAPTASGHERHSNGVAPVVSRNGVVKSVISRVDDRVRIALADSNSDLELRGLKRKIEEELHQVQSLVKRLEAKELQIASINASNTTNRSAYTTSGLANLGSYNQPHLLRVNSMVGSGGHPETRPFKHLRVSLMDNNHSIPESLEKEKRTPKANKLYRNSEFLLGKDRLPPESNKKFKPNGAGRKHGVGMEHGFGFGFGFGVDKNRDKVFKSCSNLLQRLMKHKHGWVFNSPVDAEKLGLPDYHDIIKHPMDFGTIKTRLSENLYRSARQFAEDVRLVFRNAMTYNPKGQDVHTMAEDLSTIFEDKWASIEKEFFPYQMYYDAGLPTPPPRKTHPLPSPMLVHRSIPAPSRSAPPMRTFDRSESITMPRPANIDMPHTVRTPVPKKPKAKDPNKRDMTYEEKQKLSTNLQSLPSEKLDAVVQIINKRNSGLSQHNDEIEVDIDSVDAETLWELDRFVTNYKKSLSKNKKKAELAEQARVAAAQGVPATNQAPDALNSQRESISGGNVNPAPVQAGTQVDNASPSSSSSSSSSDSGSSSSDSDSDSSSASEDGGGSPRT